VKRGISGFPALLIAIVKSESGGVWGSCVVYCQSKGKLDFPGLLGAEINYWTRGWGESGEVGFLPLLVVGCWSRGNSGFLALVGAGYYCWTQGWGSHCLMLLFGC